MYVCVYQAWTWDDDLDDIQTVQPGRMMKHHETSKSTSKSTNDLKGIWRFSCFPIACGQTNMEISLPQNMGLNEQNLHLKLPNVCRFVDVGLVDSTNVGELSALPWLMVWDGLVQGPV